MRAPLDDPAMAGFMARLDDINALAERSPGFVWRMQGEDGNNTYLRPYEDERIIVNTAHAELLKQRREWFEAFDRVFLALWWIPVGHIPTIDEAKARLASIEQNGPTPFGVTFKTMFEPFAMV